MTKNSALTLEENISQQTPRMDLRLWNMEDQRIDSVSFVRGAEDGRFDIRIESETYSVRTASRVAVAPPGVADLYAVTVITGTLAESREDGSVAMVVNCGHPSPVLQLAVRATSSDVRSWTWRITHDIQHQLLDLVGDGAHQLPEVHSR